MDIKCSAVSSVLVYLTFDDQHNKERLIAVGDLIDCEYNANGLRKHIIGKVVSISTVGNDPKGWYIVVDGSDDFDGLKARFSPMNILDVDILSKGDSVEIIHTPLGDTGVPFLRIMKGRLQYSKDGYNWKPIRIDNRDIIEPQEGTVPVGPPPSNRPRPIAPPPIGEEDDEDEDGIEDANW